MHGDGKVVLALVVLLGLWAVPVTGSDIFTSLANVQECYKHEQEFADLVEVTFIVCFGLARGMLALYLRRGRGGSS
jgi:hypothetical protein